LANGTTDFRGGFVRHVIMSIIIGDLAGEMATLHARAGHGRQRSTARRRWIRDAKRRERQRVDERRLQ
jgi:hypothetical protein